MNYVYIFYNQNLIVLFKKKPLSENKSKYLENYASNEKRGKESER